MPSWRREFPGEKGQLAVLRRWLVILLPDRPARDDVLCVATELSTNAVLHSASGQQGWFTVEVACHGAFVRVSVADQGAARRPLPGGPGEHGRGLLLVEALSARTGTCCGPHSHVAWADVPWRDEGVDLEGCARAVREP
jgi:serine/threonine-protein kinase RsbW